MLQFCLEQLIKELTHIIGDLFPCTDLIFTSQPNLVLESGGHSFFHENCHYMRTVIVLAKFSYKVF